MFAVAIKTEDRKSHVLSSNGEEPEHDDKVSKRVADIILNKNEELEDWLVK